MPLIKRLIEPTELSRGKLTNSSASELEAVSVNTLCGIMRQLSSLSKHAEDVFGELFTEASNINKRSESLQARIQSLSMKVTQLDSAGEQSEYHITANFGIMTITSALFDFYRSYLTWYCLLEGLF